ncbi:MAG TPA: biotin/lipoyl-binding protein, partial [Candidatus Krumholzibacteria bacterium]|nr:biotin/lipoyl-binding protein [Candidatus Krumholzibacteria bacterium]
MASENPTQRGMLFGALLLSLILLIATFSACSKHPAKDEGKDASKDGQSTEVSSDEGDSSGTNSQDDSDDEEKPEKAVSVNVCDAFRGELVVPIVAEGTIRARHTAELRFELSGKIDRILVEEGQTVRKGQLLAELDGREYSIRIEEA